MRIGVIGSGIGGLAASWTLAARHEVTLIEKQASPGMAAHGVDVLPGVRVDVPLRVFYPGYYPELTALYAAIGVETAAVDYSASFSDLGGERYFRYRNLTLGRWAVPYMNPVGLARTRARRIATDVLRYYREARSALDDGSLEGVGIAEWLVGRGYSPEFVEGFLVPNLCAICTCDSERARRYPARIVVEYMTRGVLFTAVRRAVHGSRDVVARLLSRGQRRLCGATVGSVRRVGGGVRVDIAGSEPLSFDHVVIATQANQALRFLGDAGDDERAILGGIQHDQVVVVTHTDASLMPRRRADWAPINALVSRRHDRPMFTIWMNAVQPSLRDQPPLFQTVNPLIEPLPKTVLGVAKFERPVVDVASDRLLGRLDALHAEPHRRIWFCGSWARRGIPLLEGAVASVRDVARGIDEAASSTR